MWPIQLAFPVSIVCRIFLSSTLVLCFSKITQETPLDKKPSLGEKVKSPRVLWYGENPNDNLYKYDGKSDAEKTWRLIVVSLLGYEGKHKLLFSNCSAMFSARAPSLIMIVACWWKFQNALSQQVSQLWCAESFFRGLYWLLVVVKFLTFYWTQKFS